MTIYELKEIIIEMVKEVENVRTLKLIYNILQKVNLK